MNILFIHQNFPGQYKHLAPLLAARGHRCVALTPRIKEPRQWRGVTVLPYGISRSTARDVHPWMADLETKVIRGEACHDAARKLADETGFAPDVILAHHGWGEPMFLKEIWPEARLGLYCELYHSAEYPMMGFDPEFERSGGKERLRIRLRNLNNVIHFDVGDAGLSPTTFQAETFPAHMRDRIDVIHDGIDTDTVRPRAGARLDVGAGRVLTRSDEVVTFINRNLEPYRGYHVFMRALPDLLQARPEAQVVLLGGDEVSYGAKAPDGQTWKQIFIDEVRGQIPDADWARVHFLGRVPYERYLDLIQVSRVHVYLTYPFVLSWSLLEAMSAGCAIVASDTAPVKEVMTDGETGVLVDFFDRSALVDQVSRLLDDSDRRKALGEAARAHVVKTYDLKSICLPTLCDWVDRLAAMPSRQPLI